MNLDLMIKDKFPLLPRPRLPEKDVSHDIYKCLIHDYFGVGAMRDE